DRKRPGQPVALAPPIAAGADPEPREQIFLADLLGFLRRKLRVGLHQLGRRRLDVVAIFSDDLDNRRLLLTRPFIVVRFGSVARFRLGGTFGHGATTPGKSEGSLEGTADQAANI